MVKNCALIIFGLVSRCCSGNPVLVLDDQDGSGFSMTRAFEGSYAPCLEDAFQGQFVHDWANNKGSSSATFSFDPPKDGCYLVEEYHPGRNLACSKYLPQAAKLQIGYCRGRTEEVSIDQSRDGGKWNTVGKWPFFVGEKGYFKMYNSEGDSCSAEQCFWVADAFRVTWTGHDCRTPAPASSAVEVDTSDEHVSKGASKEEGNADEVDGIAKEEDSPDEVDRFNRFGTVSLMVSSGHTSEDLELKIKNLGVLETALKQQFGYKSVNLLSVSVFSQRRLSQLLGSASDRRIDAEFEGTGSLDINSEQTFTEVLQGLFDAHDAGIFVKSAGVDWGISSTGQSPGAENENEKGEGNRKPVLDWLALGGCFLAVVALLGVSALLNAMRKSMMKKYAEEHRDMAFDVTEVVPEDPKQAVKVTDEAQDDLEVVSVSTAPPPSSDADDRSDSASVTQGAANGPESP